MIGGDAASHPHASAGPSGDVVIGLLTWPVYGTWLAGATRGRIEICRGPAFTLPEPDRALTAARRKALTWPAARLDEVRRNLVERDLVRIAELRRFSIRRVLIATDHVHLLLECPGGTAIPVLVQRTKGALARALSVAEGDPAPLTAGGHPARHHKWWARQYVFQVLATPEALECAIAALQTHAAPPAHPVDAAGDRA